MKLISFTVENFRCYQNPFKVKVDNFTTIVGKNDIGKSALLEALSIYFEQSKMDKFDASVSGDVTNVKISCEFTDLPNELIIDADNPTTLEQEFLLNEEGNLEITKTYNASLATPKISSIYAKANHPTAVSYSDLLTLKRTELLDRANELQVDLSEVNRTKSAEIRSAIWSFSPDLMQIDSQVDLQKEAGKKVWSALSKYLPAYWLFKSDRASTDQDAEAQDPLNAAIAEAIKVVEQDLEAITERVKAEVTKVAQATLLKLSEMDAELSGTLNPVVENKKWESLFRTSITGDDGIPLNKRGSGVRRLILLNFFRAQVEARAVASGYSSVIYAIEEPETSQHPRNQRLLFSTLYRLTSDPAQQILVTTHTPMLARAVPDDKIRYIYDEGGERQLSIGGPEINAEISKSLGVLPDHNVKLFIGVEGPNDISFLTEISKVLNSHDDNFVNLEQFELNGEIIFIPLGGSCLALWADRLQALNKPELHICDRDNIPPLPPKYVDHVRQVGQRQGCMAFSTNKREMENYIHPDAIIEAYRENGVDIVLPKQFNDFDDVPNLVAESLQNTGSAIPWNNLNPEKQKKKASKAKKILNNLATQKMTVDRLRESGGFDEISVWFGCIKELLEV